MKDTILYIDDEIENLESFRLAFWSRYNILLAGSTAEAEKLLPDHEIKLIITDQKMNEETGIEFINRIKEQYPNLLFVVLTGYAELDLAVDAINVGVYQFIQKPWEPVEMEQVIAHAIEKYDLQKQNKELLEELRKKNLYLKDSNDELLSLARQFREKKRASEENEKVLDAIFKNLPLIVLVIDSDRKILKVNKTGLEVAEKNNEESLGIKPGDLLRCINSLSSPDGCGSSESCKDCLINNTILNTLKYQTDYYKVKTQLKVKRGENIENQEVWISTTFIEGVQPMIVVSIDDVTEKREVIALK